uniref:Uncharacterized protein n=1 Tax=Anguilla anguilla TaxID=7936 RepID=A0A0E9W5M4_ANGAN
MNKHDAGDKSMNRPPTGFSKLSCARLCVCVCVCVYGGGGFPYTPSQPPKSRHSSHRGLPRNQDAAVQS